MTVQAVTHEVKGCLFLNPCQGVPKVSLLPYRAYLYSCGAPTCEEGMCSKLMLWNKWSMAVLMTCNKLVGNLCGFCFKLSEEAHR